MREDLALLGEDIRSQVRAALIAEWGSKPGIPVNPLLRPLAFALSVAALIFALGLLFRLAPAWPLAVILIVNLALLYLTRKVVAQIVAAIDSPASHLAILAHLIKRIEAEQFQAPLLRHLMERLRAGHLSAATQIRRLGRWVEMLGMSSHSLMKIVEWGVALALASGIRH